MPLSFGASKLGLMELLLACCQKVLSELSARAGLYSAHIAWCHA